MSEFEKAVTGLMGRETSFQKKDLAMWMTCLMKRAFQS